ncbi:MAG TPA: hypothetical protein DCK79_09030 [Candidatus Atribacteria bacterium]|jgi:drug/metabolite transporter (DMT)-like permease|nr:hypothetical protein [Candidatus Atribacteria bacterium]
MRQSSPVEGVRNKLKVQGILMMVIAAICFAVLAMFIKFVPNIPLMIFKKGIPILGNKRSLLLLRSILTIFAMTSYFYTIKVMILTDALTIKQLAPLLSIFFAAIILKEKVNFKQISIFIFGFLGMLLIVKPGIRPDIFPAIIGLGGATLTAISYIMIRYLRSDDHPLVIVNYFGYVIGLTSLGVLLWQRIFLFRAKK